MNKQIIVAGLALMAAPTLASADILGAGVGVSYWNSDLSGNAATNNDRVDLENDLDLSSDDNANFTAFFEHPIPLLPNVRFNYTNIEQSGRGQIGPEGFDGLGAGVDVNSSLDLTQTDLTLYYEVLDNWVNLDLGLTARDLDGELRVRDVTGTVAASQTQVDAVIPMVYAAVRADLPLTGFSVGAEGNAVSYGGDSVMDISAYAQYQLSAVQLRAGYRQMDVDYEDGDDELDVEIGGPFVSAGVAF